MPLLLVLAVGCGGNQPRVQEAGGLGEREATTTSEATTSTGAVEEPEPTVSVAGQGADTDPVPGDAEEGAGEPEPDPAVDDRPPLGPCPQEINYPYQPYEPSGWERMGPPPEGMSVVLSVEPAAVGPGEAVTVGLSVRNDSNQPIESTAASSQRHQIWVEGYDRVVWIESWFDAFQGINDPRTYAPGEEDGATVVWHQERCRAEPSDPLVPVPPGTYMVHGVWAGNTDGFQSHWWWEAQPQVIVIS